MNAKSCMMFLAATACALAQANEWNVTSGNWTDASSWEPQSVPARGDSALLAPKGEGTTTVSVNADVTTALTNLTFRAAAGGVLSFDATGHAFKMPETDGVAYMETPVRVQYANGTDYLLVGKGKEESWTSAAPLYAEDATASLSVADKDLTLSLAGVWNFYDPDGTAHPDRTFEADVGAVEGTTLFEMSGKDTVATFPEFHYRANALTNKLRFAGGAYTIHGNLYSTDGGLDMQNGGLTVAEICDGADVTVDGSIQLHAQPGTFGETNPAYRNPYRFRLADSTLTTKVGYEAWWSLDGLTYVTNSTWNAPGPGTEINAISIGNANTDWMYVTTQRLVAVDSAFNVGTAHARGNFAIGKIYSSGSVTHGEIYATNCTFNVKSWFSLRSGVGVLKDCTYTGNAVDRYSLSIEDEATLTLEGGTYSGMIPRLNFSDKAKVGPTLNIRGATVDGSGQSWLLGDSNSAADCAKTCTVHMTSGKALGRWVYLSPSAQPGHFILEGGDYSVKMTQGGSGTHAQQPTKGGWAHFTANGGTVLCPDQEAWSGAKMKALFAYLDCLDVGPNGFNLDTNGKKNHFMVQDVTNMAGEKGRFVKRGAEQLRLVIPSKWDVAETVIEAGSLLIDTNGVSTAVAMATAMNVGSGATLSTVGNAAALTLDALAVTNGTIALDVGDTVTVKGAFSASSIKFSFSTALTEDVPVDFLVLEQTPSLETITALKLAFVTAGLPSGLVAGMSFATDAETGHTTVSVTAQQVPVVSDATVWNGADSDWNKAANWSAGVPTMTKNAMLTNGEATKDIAVTNMPETGSLTFADDGFSIGGAGMVDFAAYGNSRIDVTEGSHEISAGMLTREAMAVSVASGAELAITGAGEGRGIVKEGKGRLVFDGTGNYQSGTVKAHGGRLVISNEAAFAGATVTLGNGTLEIPEGANLANAGRLAIAATNVVNDKASGGFVSGAVVIDNAGDATFTGLDTTSGNLVKRGAGTLTLDLSDGKTTWLVKSNGDYAAGGGVFAHTAAWTFDEDGTPPTIGYGGLSVMGGELVIKGDGETSVASSGALIVGSHTKSDCGAQPMLTFDNLKLDFNPGYYEIVVGNRAGCKDYFAKRPVLRILNGSTITLGNDLKLSSDYTSENTPDGNPVIAITNSTVVCKNLGYGDPTIYFSTLRSRSKAVANLLTLNATLEAKKFGACGMTESRITGSTLTGVGGGYATFNSDQYRKGRVLFDGGTLIKVDTLAITAYNASYTQMMTWAFDDATWDFGTADFAITSANCYLPLNQFEMVGTGLRLTTAAGQTFSTDAAFVGEGGLVKSGEGTLKFGADTYRFTGTLTAVAGTVDLTDAGAVTNACFAGGGTIKNGTLVDARIAMGDAIPNFENCSFSGKGFLDVGATRPKAGSNRLVATYTGTAPDVSKWRLAGAGKRGVKGVFTAADGEIRVTFKSNGLVVVAW